MQKDLSGGGLLAQSCPTPVTLWTVACLAPLSTGISRQGCWSGLPFPSPGDLPDPRTEPGSPRLQADSLPAFRTALSKPVFLIMLKLLFG